MNRSLSQDTFNSLLNKLTAFAVNVGQKADNFVDLLAESMQIVEDWAGSVGEKIIIHGLQKKELVIALMTELGSKFTEEKDKFQLQLKTVMDKLIDVLVSASKGQLHFNDFKETVSSKCCGKKKLQKHIVRAPKDIAEIEAIANKVHEDIKNMISNKQFNVSNLIMLVTMVMQALEQLPQLTGAEKKAVAMKVIKRLVMEIPIPGIDTMEAGLLIDVTLSKTIDFIIAAANGEFNFGQIAQEVVSKWKACFPCCFKTQTPPPHTPSPVIITEPATPVPTPVSVVPVPAPDSTTTF